MEIIYYAEINTICLIVLGLLLVSLPKGQYQSSRGRVYKLLLGAAMLLCVSDMTAGILRGQMFAGAAALLWLSNGMYFAASTLIAWLWTLYAMLVLTGKIDRITAAVTGIFGGALCLAALSAPLNGWLFTIDADNLYHRGPYVWLHWLYAYPCELLPSILALFSGADSSEKKAVSMFVALPLAAAMIQSLVYGVSCTQAGITGGLLLLYVILQAREVNEVRIRADLLDRIAGTDTLTRLGNRRAYEARIEEMTAMPWVGAVFMDLNGLKAANDLLGHKAGDELLTGFADFLRGIFPEPTIFRISGDEFVVLTADRRELASGREALCRDVGDRAAWGTAEGAGADTIGLIKEAEKHMYEDKHRYYVRTGLDRRRT